MSITINGKKNINPRLNITNAHLGSRAMDEEDPDPNQYDDCLVKSFRSGGAASIALGSKLSSCSARNAEGYTESMI